MTHSSPLAHSLTQTPDPQLICTSCVDKQVNVIVARRRSEIQLLSWSARILKSVSHKQPHQYKCYTRCISSHTSVMFVACFKAQWLENSSETPMGKHSCSLKILQCSSLCIHLRLFANWVCYYKSKFQFDCPSSLYPCRCAFTLVYLCCNLWYVCTEA